MIVTFQAAFPGAPLIYYGDEAGMWGDDDPDDRKPMIWPDMTYDEEEYSALGKDYAPDKVEFDHELFNSYQKLYTGRKKSKALRLGDFNIELADDNRSIFGFSRTYEDEKAFAFFNNSEVEQMISVDFDDAYSDILGHLVNYNNGHGQLVLPAKSAAILLREN